MSICGNCAFYKSGRESNRCEYFKTECFHVQDECDAFSADGNLPRETEEKIFLESNGAFGLCPQETRIHCFNNSQHQIIWPEPSGEPDMEIRVKYHPGARRLEYLEQGDWIDLAAAETVFVPKGEMQVISLGISVQLPEGYEAVIAPRSSTFVKYGIILPNSIGVIDNSYCGDDDIWRFPAYCLIPNTIIGGTEGSVIRQGDRIAQFRILKSQPRCRIVETETLGNPSRGGFGSTGV